MSYLVGLFDVEIPESLLTKLFFLQMSIFWNWCIDRIKVLTVHLGVIHLFILSFYASQFIKDSCDGDIECGVLVTFYAMELIQIWNKEQGLHQIEIDEGRFKFMRSCWISSKVHKIQNDPGCLFLLVT